MKSFLWTVGLLMTSLIVAISLNSMIVPAISLAAGLSEGFLIEGDLKQGARVATGRVLIEAGHRDWMTIAMTPATKKDPALRLQARATLVEADVVEIETRITGRGEQNGRMIVRVGERGEMTTSQLEGAAESVPPTSLGLKVLRVRYGL